MNGGAADPFCARLHAAALWLCAAIAVASLPSAALPWAWQAALLLPAAALAATRWTDAWPFRCAAAAAVVQFGACLVAHEFAGPLARPAALAGTILPPLAFVTVRRRGGDAALGLFLSFCVLLVGAILGSPRYPILAAYVAAAVVQLRCDSRLRAIAAGAPARAPAALRAPGLALGGLWFGCLCALSAFAVERTLHFLPVATTETPRPAAPADNGRRRAGLSDTFALGGDGSVLELRGERLVTVAAAGPSPVGRDLYLRSGFFQVPGLDSWHVGTLAPERRDSSRDDWRLRAPEPGTPPQRLEVTRLQGARNTVFVPPGTYSILGIPDLLGDARREWFRQQPGAPIDVYEVLWQDLPPSPDLTVDMRWSAGATGLLSLPDDFDESLFRPLLDEFGVRGPPLDRADAIAAGLQARCRYERREPGGPHAHALLNFLHGERVGFCMHFASAAAILLRLSGVPCRIGVGLFGGAEAPDGQREFGSQHSHAWVEIPIVGRGWVTLDPTPPAARGTTALVPAPDDAAVAAGGPEESPGMLARARDAVVRALSTVWPWLGVLLVLLLPLSRRGPALRRAVLAKSLRPARRFLVHILRALGERGWPRLRGATIEQYAASLRAAGALSPDLSAAFATYQEVRFGERPWDGPRELSMQRGLHAAGLVPPRAAADAPTVTQFSR